MSTFICCLVCLCLITPQGESPNSWLDRFQLAEKTLEAGDAEKAIPILESCFEYAPENATTAYHLACALTRTERPHEAILWLKRAVDWGWVDAEVMLWDEDLASLHQYESFEGIVARTRAEGKGKRTARFEVFKKSKVSEKEEAGLILSGQWLNIGWPRILPDDATALIPVDDGSIRAFDLHTGRLKWLLKGPTDEIYRLELKEDGSRAVIDSVYGTASVYDLQEREWIREFRDVFPVDIDHMSPRSKLHPDGNRLLTFFHAYPISNQKPAIVWSVEKGEKLYEVPIHEGINAMAWSQDGSLLGSAHRDCTVRLWDATTGSPVGKPMPHPCPVSSIAFDPKGNRLATGTYIEDVTEDDKIRIWSVPQGGLLSELPLSGTFLGCFEMAFLAWTSKGDLIATTCAWPTIECWDGKTLEHRWLMEEYDGGNHSTLYVTWNPQCTRYYVWGMGYWNTRVINPSTGQTMVNLGAERYWALSATSDDKLIIANHRESEDSKEENTIVLDGTTFTERYRRAELPDGEALLCTPGMIHMGSAKAIRKSFLSLDGEESPLESFAPILYDPKRFLAAAAGIPVQYPEIPTPGTR